MVTKDEIQKIAKLAKLYIDDSELDELTQSMAAIIGFADTINEAASFDAKNEDVSSGAPVNAMREDVVVPSFENEEILKNCKTARDGFFYIAKSNRKK